MTNQSFDVSDCMKKFTYDTVPRLQEVSRDLVGEKEGNRDAVPLLVLWLCLTRHLDVCGFGEDMMEELKNGFAF